MFAKPCGNGTLRLFVAMCALAFAALLALPAFAAGWVGVGGAMREDTRSIVFGNPFGSSPQQRYAFSGHKNFGVFRCLGTWDEIDLQWVWGSWAQTSLDEFALWDANTADIGTVNCLVSSDIFPLVLAGTNTGQVWRSTDHGVTWLKAFFPSGFTRSAIMDLARHAETGHVYACTWGDGLYKSTDGGANFTLLTSSPAGTNHFMDLEFHPSYASNSNLFVCTASDGNNSGGIYQWTGSGWADLSANLPEVGDPVYRKYSFSAIAVAPGLSYIWAGDLDGGGVVVSADQGVHWARTCGFICEPVMEVRIAPDCTLANQHVMFGTDVGWYESISGVCYHRFPKGLAVKSIAPDPNWDNNFTLWLATSDGIRILAPNAFPQPPADQNQSIFDISYLAPSPSSTTGDQTIYAASSQFGIFLSRDFGGNWAQYMAPLANATSGANIGQPVTALALVPTFSGGSCTGTNATVYMATQGGGVYKSDIAGSSWLQINDANLPPSLEVSCLAHTPPLNPSALDYPLFAGFASAPVIFRYNDLSGLWGATGLNLSGSRITALAIPPNHDGTTNAEVFAGTDAGLFKSADRGTTWIALAAGTNFPSGASGAVTALAFSPSYKDDHTIFANRYGSGVYRSTDGGTTWSNMNLTPGCPGSPAYLWNFGDGQTSTQQNATHTYSSNPNPYTWNLNITYNGQTLVRTGQVRTKPDLSCRLKDYSASATPSAGGIPLRVQFDASAVPINCAGSVTYYWEFGDTGTSTEQRPVHVYISAQTYIWRLTITLPTSETYISTGQVLAQNAASCTWTGTAGASPASGPAPLTVAFTSAIPIMDVTALALSPDYPTDPTLVVGTDVPGQRNSGGVFVCTNADAAPQNAFIWGERNLNLADRHVRTLAYVKPSSGPKRLLCGTQRQKVFYNDDITGDTSAWQPTYGYSSTTGEIRAVVLSPTPTNLGCTPSGSPGSSGSDVFAGGTHGVFWSNDGGETFRPLNKWLSGTTAVCPPVVNCLFAFNSPVNGKPMLLAGTDGVGIWYLYASQDGTFWDWTGQMWQPASGTSGKVLNFTRETDVIPFRVRAASDGGVYSSSDGENWSVSGGSFTDIANGQVTIGFSYRGLPDPDAPGSSSTWGTVSGTGVQKGTETTPGFTGAIPSPAEIEWELRNGSGAGTLSDLDVQSVIQLSDSPTYTVLTGTTNSGVFRSEDEGVDFWYASNDGFLSGASKYIKDFVESSNGDVLLAMYGPSNGGVYLSADLGRHWVSISQGFTIGQTLASIICNDEDPPTYYAGAYSAGSYATTIEPLPDPTITSISASTATTTEEKEVTIQGTNFQCSCPEDYTCATGCAQAKVSFGGFDATPKTGSCTGTSLTVYTPVRPPGMEVYVSVRNADTRTSAPYSAPFTFTDGSDVTVTLSRNTSNQVEVSWTGSGSPTKIYRSPRPDFSQALTTAAVSSSPYIYSDSSGTDSNIYYYSVE